MQENICWIWKKLSLDSVGSNRLRTKDSFLTGSIITLEELMCIRIKPDGEML